jgi:hypothetical protein
MKWKETAMDKWGRWGVVSQELVGWLLGDQLTGAELHGIAVGWFWLWSTYGGARQQAPGAAPRGTDRLLGCCRIRDSPLWLVR